MAKSKSEIARETRNAYKREYYRTHKEQHRQWQENYWLRVAERNKEATATEE